MSHQSPILLVATGIGKENELPLKSADGPAMDYTGGDTTRVSPITGSQFSQPKSPVQQNLQSFSPRKHFARNQDVSFTPCRAQLHPRAWERIPAKPFQARSEGQKIWKRVPLQDIGIDLNVYESESHRDRNAKQDYLRAVKRMKIDADVTTQKHPNVPHGISMSGFWTTRFEEDSIDKGGSPKKKARHQPISDTTVEAQQAELDETTERANEETGPVQISSPEKEEPRFDQEDMDHCTHAGSMVQEIAAGSCKLHSNSSKELKSREPSYKTSSTPSEHGQGVSDEFDLAVSDSDLQPHTEIPSLSAQIAVHESEVNDQSDTGRLGDATPEVTEETPEDSLRTHVAKEELHLLLQASSTDKTTIQDEAEGPRSPRESVETALVSTALPKLPSIMQTQESKELNMALADCAELFDLSVLTEHIQFDQNHSDKSTNHTTVSDILASMPSPDVNKAALSRSTSTMSGLEQEEDTAFLAEFLLRAKASKAAREAASSGSTVAGRTSPTKKHSPSRQSPLVALSPEQERNDRGPALIDSSDGQEQTVEMSASSPLRRSTRTANTRLPRPQTLPPVPQFGPVLPSQHVSLPNTIQLKRATGNEFVFNAKPQQNVHVMTRTNTKRNQGNAVHADVRLQQLKSEGPDQAMCNSTQPGIIPQKKRKRAKEDDTKSSRKPGKNVTWQEDLVSYREATPIDVDTRLSASEDFVAIESAAQVEALRPMTDSFRMPETLGGTSAESEDLQSNPPSNDGASSAKPKVRKIRKINVGNVNGTPAPKTRTRSQLQAQPDMEATLEASQPTTRAHSVVERKSKMPLPVAVLATPAMPQGVERKLDGQRKLRART